MERYRFHTEGSVFFVTFSIVEWLPVFVSEAACRIVTESLNYCHRHKGLRTNAYVIMPTHMHGIFFHETFAAEQLQSVLTDFRKFTGRQLSDFCGKHAPPCFSAVLRANAGEDRERRFWQATRHPELIDSERFWKQKADYLHDNPCRKGLVARADYWRFSSAGFWLCEPRIINDVTLSGIDW
jgi:REP element-mobilizing transposase RayT